ncbi:uncharacterized protein LOC123528614 [Mercenaria mercenaria]|uniref:uncharacterized protein LOC123528614 n=1 Tax=Mercenaria mercenaria TaxID=6596 RepID=UPI00234EE401|nr:uncharacterized protein LOC123528614 [Mercenaria mercenaria]
MAEARKFMLKTENYKEQCRLHWPPMGRHIMAQYDEECIVVYQAFCPEIADYAVQNGKFGGNVRIQWDPDHDPKGENQRRRAVQLGIKGIPLQRFHEQFVQHIEDITDFVKQQRQHVLKNELDKLITPVERVYRPSDEAICRHILLDEFHGSEKGLEKEKPARGEAISTDDRNKNDDKVGNVSGRKVDGAYCEELNTMKTQQPVHKDGKVDLIVCLGGSFNPVNTRHIQLLDTAISWLEKNSHYNVVAARLAVAPDSYVEKKCKRKGEECIKAEHRIKLCELACKGHKLIKTHYTTTSSAHNCGDNVRKWENWLHAKVAVVIGADKAVCNNGTWRWHSKNKYLTVCVGRKGKTDIVRKAYLKDYKEDLASNSEFCLIEEELEDVSSTEIRRKLGEVENNMKSVKNCQKNIENSDTRSNMKEIKQMNEVTEEPNMNTADRIVPVSWDDITDEEMQPQERVHAENNSGTSGERAKFENDRNVPLKWDELDTEENEPLNWDGLKLDQDSDNENSSHCRKLDLKNENNGARLKTSTYVTGTQSTETVATSNKFTDQNINIPTRKSVVESFVSKGWLAEAVGEYILDKFSDLYL